MSLALDHPSPHAEPRFDVRGATRALVRWIAIAMVGTAVIVSAILALLGRADWWQGFAAATVLSVLAAGASIAAMRVGLGFGIAGAIGGHFVGAGMRFLIVLGGGLILLWAGEYPALPTLVLAVPYYLATLAAEVVAMARTFNTPASPN